MSTSSYSLIVIFKPAGGWVLDWQKSASSGSLASSGSPTISTSSSSLSTSSSSSTTSSAYSSINRDSIPRGNEFERRFYDSYLHKPTRTLYDYAFAGGSDDLSPSLGFLLQVGRRFVEALARIPEIEFSRDQVRFDFSEGNWVNIAAELIEQAPFVTGLEFLDYAWIGAVWGELFAAFASDIADFKGSVAEYFEDRHAVVKPVGRVFFHLVENKSGELPFAFMATYSSGLNSTGQVNHVPLANALREFQNDRDKLLGLLATVYRAAEGSELVRELLDTGEIFQPIGFTADEAYIFLREIPLYEAEGVICRMPDWWRVRSGRARVSVRVGEREPSRVGLGALVDFDAQIMLGDLSVSEEDIRQMLAETEGLTLIKGRWVEVDHSRLASVLKAYKDAEKLSRDSNLNLIEALRLQLKMETGQNADQADADSLIEIENGSWLRAFAGVLDGSSNSGVLGRDGKVHEVGGIVDQVDVHEAGEMDCGHDFRAVLRAYQVRGLRWLRMMKSLGLGACLADDMGLGKTVQVIALLNETRSRISERSLLIVPASLIANWRQEVEKFAPGIQVHVLHPSESRSLPVASAEMTTEIAASMADECDLIITTYSMLSRYEWLRSVRWDNLILDEAQAIKNPSTRQAQAARKFDAAFRLALTGTPIENNLTDLWSLFNFLNRGLLGSAKEFAAFLQRLRQNYEGYGRLKQMIKPFVLRRLKTDRDIIQDLPAKVELKSYAGLSKKQTILYSKLVEDLRVKLMTLEDPIARRGLVLGAIMKFKQICNHPDHYLGQSSYKEAESGKFLRLRELCETIYEKRERVLVFTQFREMTEPLQRYLEQVFEHPGLVLHGGTPVAKRKKIVDEFQGEAYVPFLILSIKAGGVGLNLTAANHVIHFDRWWNPAVENQATDRAFRIGQSKNVMVHKFITSGTIEEKIDQMIEEKNKLAGDIIPDKQETWITELDNQQ